MLRLAIWAFLALTLCFSGCTSSGKVNDDSKTANDVLLVYSELDKDFTSNLLELFNKDNSSKTRLQAVFAIEDGGKRPGLVLAEQKSLYKLKQAGLLKPAYFPAGDRLPKDFRDSDFYWYGVFYDPAVFLVNQRYARNVGQAHLNGWTDLERLENIRIALENLTDSSSTQNFLAALSDHMGETAALNYLLHLNRFIGQYSKFPFTPVRMTAVGDADLAITRQSYVFKYLENKFPAYVVVPREGTPVNLFGVAMLGGQDDETVALRFMEWLLNSDKVQAVAQADETGYMFLFPAGISETVVGADKLWLNKSYLTDEAQEQLTAKWLEKVRFGSQNR